VAFKKKRILNRKAVERFIGKMIILPGEIPDRLSQDLFVDFLGLIETICAKRNDQGSADVCSVWDPIDEVL
jgi:hypothetical protein